MDKELGQTFCHVENRSSTMVAFIRCKLLGGGCSNIQGIIKKRLEQADKQGRRYEGNWQSPRLVSGDYCVQGPKYHRISIEHAPLHLDKLRIKTTI